MSNRPAPLAAEHQIALGRRVLALRQQGYRWNTIERLTGMERTQLWRCARRGNQKDECSNKPQNNN